MPNTLISHNSIKYTSEHGFTLLELLIAISVFAFLSVASYGGLNAVLKTREHTSQAAENLQKLQLGLAIMQRDLAQISDATARDEFGDHKAAIVSQTAGTGDETLLTFTRNGWQNPGGQMRSSLQRVSYVFAEKILYRQYQRQLNAAPSQQPVRAKLLENIEQAKLEFLDAEKQWHEQWPPANSQDIASAPLAIRITLTTDNDIEFKRLFSVKR